MIEKEIALAKLLADGMTVPGVTGPVTVFFKQVGKPFTPSPNSGFQAVRVKSDFGGFTTLFYSPESKVVSGLVWVRR